MFNVWIYYSDVCEHMSAGLLVVWDCKVWVIMAERGRIGSVLRRWNTQQSNSVRLKW